MLLIENVGSTDHVAPLLPITSKSCLVVATSRKDLSLDLALGTGMPLRWTFLKRLAWSYAFLKMQRSPWSWERWEPRTVPNLFSTFFLRPMQRGLVSSLVCAETYLFLSVSFVALFAVNQILPRRRWLRNYRSTHAPCNLLKTYLTKLTNAQ